MRRRVSFAGMILVLALQGSMGEAKAYELAEVVNGATISGKVTFTGTVPAPKRFVVEKDPEVCGQERALIEVAARNGFLQGAVVVLEGVERGKPFPAGRYRGAPPGEGEFRYGGGEQLSLDVRAKTCNFGPFTGVLSPNEPVRFLNRDPMKHVLQTFSASGDKGRVLRTIHNRDMHPEMTIERFFSTSKLKTSRVVRIACNRHDFMQNWFYVVETPYYAISDQDGHFTIDQIPPGNYELVVWHPALGLKRKAVQVTAGGNVEVSFGFAQE